MSKFNRTEFMIQKWTVAKNKEKIYRELSGDREKHNSKEFLRNANPLDTLIEVYYVSTQANYQSGVGGIYTEPKTFKVIALKSFETQNTIQCATKTAFASMKISNDTFNPQFQKAIEKHTSVDFENIRGLEEVKEYKLSESEYSQLLSGNFIIEDLDKNVSFTKNKKGKGVDSKSYKAQLDLSGFI